MKFNNPKEGDKNMEILMGNLLRYGVLISAMFVLAGSIIYLAQHGFEKPQYHYFLGEPYRLIHLKDIIENALKGHAKSIIQFGLILLIATPVARIVFSIIGFFLEKDYLYVVITAIVLSIIILSFVF